VRWGEYLRPFSTLLAILSLAAVATTRAEQAAAPASPRESMLRKELLVRAEKDQAVRRKLITLAKQQNGTLESILETDKPIRDELLKIDADNCQWLKNAVERYGWPGRTLVGQDGERAAFLIIQHANADLAFQKNCLRSMSQMPNGEVDQEHIALLTDRVRLAEGKLQLYGTQVEVKDGRWQSRDVENPHELNDRRRGIGLPPIEEYLRTIEDVYGVPRPCSSSVRPSRTWRGCRAWCRRGEGERGERIGDRGLTDRRPARRAGIGQPRATPWVGRTSVSIEP
jgi:hypothetical protein